MQRGCKLEISGCLPVSIPRSLVLTNTVEYTRGTRGCRERLSRRWDHTKYHQSWSGMIKKPALDLSSPAGVIPCLWNPITWQRLQPSSCVWLATLLNLGRYFSSPTVVMHVDFRMRRGRNIQLMWEPAGKRKDVGSFPTHSNRWIVFICQSSTRQNEQNFPLFSSPQTFIFLWPSSQQLIVHKLSKTVIACCLFTFRQS